MGRIPEIMFCRILRFMFTFATLSVKQGKARVSVVL